MADNYTKVPKGKEQESISPNEIRISSAGRARRYISYGVALLDPTLIKHDDEVDAEQKKNRENQKVYDSIVLKGMGPAITKTVTIAEIIKRRVAGLHQLNEISSTTVVDEYEPRTEGLEKTTSTRSVSSIAITLSKTPLNSNAPGYQKPISSDLIQPMQPPQRQKRQKRRQNKEEKESKEAPQQSEKPARQKRKPKKSRQPKEGRDTAAAADQAAPASTTKTESPSSPQHSGERKPVRGRGRGRGRRVRRGPPRRPANGQSASAKNEQQQ
jgi:DNA-binding protein